MIIHIEVIERVIGRLTSFRIRPVRGEFLESIRFGFSKCRLIETFKVLVCIFYLPSAHLLTNGCRDYTSPTRKRGSELNDQSKVFMLLTEAPRYRVELV